MKNQFIVHWQYDYEGENNLVKVMAHDTFEGAVLFLEKSANAGTITERSATGTRLLEEGYLSGGLRWVKPGFEGTVAPLLARL
jgi:hypothetical protein